MTKPKTCECLLLFRNEMYWAIYAEGMVHWIEAWSATLTQKEKCQVVGCK